MLNHQRSNAQKATMKHLAKITAVFALTLMASFVHAADTNLLPVEVYFGTVPRARDSEQLSTVPASANDLTQTICWKGSAYVLPCSAGQTVVGHRKYWNLDSKQNESFSYQNTSTNSPWKTMSDSISIL